MNPQVLRETVEYALQSQMIRLDREIEAKYEVLAKMGEGGMGSVYKVRHRVFQDVRVIKTAKYSENAAADKARFISEAKRGYHFRHDGIARVIDFDITTEGTAYIVMEFIDGQNIRQLLANTGAAMGSYRVVEIGLQTLDALQYLHEHGLVHRDISPDNLMLTTDPDGKPRVKLIDLGIAKSMEASQNLTLAGRFIGKVAYASPEQFSGQVDQRSDLYSLGVVMYELLTGSLPVSSTDYRAVIAAHISGELLSFNKTDPEGRVPLDLRAIVMLALQRDAENRFATAHEFANALRSLSTAALDKTISVEIPAADVEAIKARRSEQIAWEAALASDTQKIWDDFLNRYPASSRSSSARARLEEIYQIEERDWSEAATAESKSGWREYLDKHPDSLRASRARRRLEKIEADETEQRAWDAAEASDTVASWESFLKVNGQSARGDSGRERLAAARAREVEERAWAAAGRADSSAAWRDFIAKQPRSQRLADAQLRLANAVAREDEEREWINAARASSIEAWQAFVAGYPQSARREEAEEQLNALLLRAEEERAWAAALRDDTTNGWRGYLRAFVNSLRSAEALRRMNEAEQREAEASDWIAADVLDTVPAWRDYVSKHPKGRTKEAQQRMVAAQLVAAEDETWRTADRTGSSAGWRTYLDQFGSSSRANDARAFLAVAEMQERAERDWKAALKRGTVAAWNDFLAQHADSSFAAEARPRLEEARDREREQQAFVEAGRSDSIEVWNDFIRRYPESPNLRVANDRLARAQAMREAHQKEEQARIEKERRDEEARLAAKRREDEARREERRLAEDARRTAAEESAWKLAISVDAIPQWGSFLAEWPSSARAPEAKRKLEEARALPARESALRAGTVKSLETFLARYGESPLAADVREKLDLLRTEQRRVELEAAERARHEAELAREEAARKEAEDRAWTTAVKNGALAAFQSFIDAHPGSLRTAEAGKRIGDLLKRERDAALTAEKRAWVAAVKRNTIAQFEEFLASHPQSLNAADAQRRIEAIRTKEREAAAAALDRAWSAAVRRNTIAEFEKFLRSYPESSHSADAGNRIDAIRKQLAEQAASARAREEANARVAADAAAAAKARASEATAREAEEARAREAQRRAANARLAEETAARTRSAEETAAASKAARLVDSTRPEASVRSPVALRAGIAAGLVISAGVGISVYLQKPARGPEKPAVGPVVQSRSGTTVAPPVISGASGQLVINAFPWGEVTSVKNVATSTEYVPAGSTLITPATMTLPPGSYKVVLTNPNSGKRKDCAATVKATESVPCEATLDTIDANDYLSRLSEVRP